MRSVALWGLGCLALALAVAGEVCAAEPGLVGWWNFDEGPGPTVADATGNGNTGTVTGGVQWMAQETGGVLEFDGSSGYVRIPFSPALNVLNQGDFTLTAWFKADAVPTENKEVFQQGDANGTGRTWLFIASSTGEIRTYLGNATNGLGSLYAAVEDNSGKIAVAVNANTNIVRVGVWTEWEIPLSSFAGVNLAKVKKLYLGVGDRDAPVAGGFGRLYIDDIRVTKP